LHRQRYTHEQSRRSNGPFIAVNCGTLPDTLVDADRLGRRVIAATNIVPHRAARATQDGRERVWPARPPADALRTSSRMLAHGSGSMMGE
jgi:hypothetical protein